MNTNLARVIRYDFTTDNLAADSFRGDRLTANDLLPDDTEEISSVRYIPFVDLDMGVEIDAVGFDRAETDPTPVYARPYSVVAGQRCDFPQRHFLGTRFLGGIIESASWEQEMRAAGASEVAVSDCRRYLKQHAL